MEKIRSRNGITLIALVITVIILLILAGVAIVTLTGENSLLEKAKKAEETTKIKNAEEIIKLMINENKIAEYQNEYLQNNQLIDKVVKKLEDEGYTIESDGDTVTYGKEKIKISDYIDKEELHKVTINAPKNSIITLKANGKEIGKAETNLENPNLSSIDIYKKLGEKVTAVCELNDEIIYEKTFDLQEINNIKMYPCEENGDGKALYWYGMELEKFESGQVTYGGVAFQNSGTIKKNDNSLNLSFVDSLYDQVAGIGINYKQDLTNYNNIEIKAENFVYTGYGIAYYIVGDIGNDYIDVDVGSMEDIVGDSGNTISEGVKKLDISAISGEKYISILSFNPSGRKYRCRVWFNFYRYTINCIKKIKNS